LQLLSIWEIVLHLRHYNLPLLQRQIVRIIIMIPVYALGSGLSLTHPDESIYVNTIRDIYEAFVIHCFLQVGDCPRRFCRAQRIRAHFILVFASPLGRSCACR
jgi:hypothetical protein